MLIKIKRFVIRKHKIMILIMLILALSGCTDYHSPEYEHTVYSNENHPYWNNNETYKSKVELFGDKIPTKEGHVMSFDMVGCRFKEKEMLIKTYNLTLCDIKVKELGISSMIIRNFKD